MKTIVQIDHYSDLLCIWAYIGHARTKELQSQYADQLEWAWHYLPVFGDVSGKFLDQWKDRGGADGYARHVCEVAEQFDHVTLNEDCWKTVQPASSAPAHLWLASARLAEASGDLPQNSEETLAWALRTAFFEHARDIAQQSVLIEVAKELGYEASVLMDRVNNGTAFAVLCQDMQMAREANIRVSPTFVFNEGRQRLTGNVGYRIIEANVKELLEQPQQQQSWC